MKFYCENNIARNLVQYDQTGRVKVDRHALSKRSLRVGGYVIHMSQHMDNIRYFNQGTSQLPTAEKILVKIVVS